MLKTLKNTLKSWWIDDPFTDSAAIAYYAIFSIPGLLVIILGLTSIFFEADMMEDQIFNNIKQILGNDVAVNIKSIVEETSLDNRNIWALVIGVVTLIFGATGLFVQLQRSLNRIWQVYIPKRKRHTPKFIKDRFISFSMIIVIGFLLLISLTITAFISALNEWFSNQISTSFIFILQITDFIFSISLITLLFTILFKILPDMKVEWRYAVKGGILSALLFHVGEYALNMYFQMAEPASTFGAAGSIILIMLWVYYSGMILLLGAEYTKQNYLNNQSSLSKAKRKNIL